MAAVAHEAPSMPTYAGVNVMARQMNPTVDGQQWLVLMSQDHRRTMSTREVQAEVQAGILPRETLVWRAGMAAWASIGNIAELSAQNTRPTVPRARAGAGWEAPLAQTAQYDSAHDDPRHDARPRAQSPQVALELFATGAAVLLIVLLTSYTLFAAGAFQPGSSPHASAREGTVHADATAEAKVEH
jgi:GYF domain 2